MEPIVSFIIPTLNAERDIARCLGAICALQEVLHPYEVLVIDNGSTDRTCAIVIKFEFKPLVIPNVHVSALRNRGADLAKGIYLAFVDADVEISKEWLHNGLSVFQDSSVVASGCFPSVPPQATWVQRAWDLHQRGATANDSPSSVAWLSSMNLLVRRDVFLRIGGFNESLETAEDVDLCYRLGRYGAILRNPEMRAIHWGEAPDLKTFWRKEVWRGIGNLGGIRSHGFRWDEVPSIGYPLYMLACALLVFLGVGFDLWQAQIRAVLLGLGASTVPPLALAFRTSLRVKAATWAPQLFVLYYLYGVARAFAMLKAVLSTGSQFVLSGRKNTV